MLAPRQISQSPTQSVDRIVRGTRFISHYRQRLIHSSPTPRPQLPFLHSKFQRSPHRLLARLLSTEQQAHFKWLARTWAKWTVVFWALVGLVSTAKFGVDNEIWERQFPTPQEWSFISRWKLRAAQGKQHSDLFGVNWSEVGDSYKALLARLEDIKGDGVGLRPPLGEGEQILVEGVGKTGFDITVKSEPWRRGYYQALIGAARAAEQLDGSVKDQRTVFIFSRDIVKDVFRSQPKPEPHGMPSAPRQHCEPAFDGPHVFYMKILTTQGFSSRQYLDAALAYAEWLGFRGLTESARDMYTWALDIAIGTAPPSTPPPIDKSTGVLSSRISKITPNLILTASSLASYHARNGNLEEALSIYLSILRVQQNLPLPPVLESKRTKPSSSILYHIRKFFTPRPYPEATASGDEPATASYSNTCALSGTMLHIGEILFALDNTTAEDSTEPSESQAAGLSWTREAVDLAESTLQQVLPAEIEQPRTTPYLATQAVKSSDASIGPKRRCAECLSLGIENWLRMIRRFQQAELRAKFSLTDSTTRNQSARVFGNLQAYDPNEGWSWMSTAKASKVPGTDGSPAVSGVAVEPSAEQTIWTQEGRRVQERAIKIRQLLREQGLHR